MIGVHLNTVHYKTIFDITPNDIFKILFTIQLTYFTLDIAQFGKLTLGLSLLYLLYSSVMFSTWFVADSVQMNEVQ